MTRRRLTHIAVACLLGTFATSAMAAGSATQWKTAPRPLAAKTILQSVDRQAPRAPSSLRVAAVLTTSISVTWGASRDNVAVAGYGVYLNGTRLASTTARSYTFSALTCGTTYKVGVDAFDAARHRSGIASVLAATAPCVDKTAPSAPGNLHQSGWSQTGLAVEWNESSDNVGVAGYSIYRDGVPVAVTQQRNAWVGGLVCGAAHTISVEAYDAAGNHSSRASAVGTTTACADTSPPAAPRNLSVSGSTESSISVAWQPSVDDRGVAEYRLSVNDVDVRTTTATAATFTGLACGRSYVVKVAAADAAGNVSPTSSVIAPTAVCPTSGGGADTQTPTTPSSLVRRDGTATSITLSWTASTDNVGVAGYGIYRGTTKVGDSGVNAYGVEGLACATSYTLSVDAVDAAGNRSARATVVASTDPCQDTQAPTAPAGIAAQTRTETSITLSWQASTDAGGVAGYRVYRDGALVGSTNSTSYTAAGLTCGKSYTFGLEAYDPSANHSARTATIFSTAACSDTVTPSAPTSFVKTGATTTSIAVSWNPASDNVAVAGYSLFLAGSAIGTTGQSSYTFSGLACGTSYALGIEAYDAAGNRSQRVSLQTNTGTCGATPPQSNGTTANLFVVPSGGSPSCTRAAAPVSYDQAVIGGNVCGPGTGKLGYATNGWNNACKAASSANTSSGTIIGVKAGVYGGTSPDGHLVKDTDCSGGQGADVNPNAAEQGVSTGTTAAWARYVCADGAGKNVSFTPGGVGFMYGSLHVVVQGSCFDFSTTMVFGPGGASAAQRVSNVQILGQDGCASDPASADCLGMYGLEIRGGKNILLKNVNYGPSLICAKNDPLITASFRCNPNGPPFEARFASAGTAQAGCTGNSTGPQCGGWFGQYEFTEAYIHAGDESMYENVRVHHFYFHDSNTRFSGDGVHPGCFMMDNNVGGVAKHNLVFDHLVCERVATVGIQLSDSGVTFQNSIFSCPVYGLDQSTPNGKWDQCAPSQYQVGNSCRTDMAPGCVVSNVVFRYNVFMAGSTGLLFQTKTGGPYGTFSNVSVVGNVFGASLTCGMPGISYDANTFLNGVGTCGTNATSLGAGDPFVQSSMASPNNSWSAVSLLNARPDGSPALPAINVVRGSDLDLGADADGAPRSATTRRPGAYN